MADILKLSKRYINLELLFRDENLATRLNAICKEESSDPKMALSATHTAFLLHKAVSHFANGALGIFNKLVASRRSNPVPLQLYDHFLHLIKYSKQAGFNPTIILASALVLNAYPPGMHSKLLLASSLPDEMSLSNIYPDFKPDKVFTCLYYSAFQKLGETLQVSNLYRDVEKLFIGIALQDSRSKTPFAQTHLSILQSISTHLFPLRNFGTCLCCFVQALKYTFSYRHRFCSCYVKIYRQNLNSLHYTLNRCLLCRNHNSNEFQVRPATARTRVLVLGGSTPKNTAKFLEDLRHKIGLITMPLAEHFDVILSLDFDIAPNPKNIL